MPNTGSSSPLTDFQKKKLTYVFNVFFDLNSDGVIEKSDFDLALENMSHITQWDKKGPLYAKAKDTLNMIWESLRSKADADKDNLVTQEEWFEMWTDSVTHHTRGVENEAMPDWEAKFMEFMFQVNDLSSDGKIDFGEYSNFFKSYGFSEDECKTAFNNLTNGKNDAIDVKAYKKLWNQYFLGNKATDPGNWIFCQKQ